MVRYSLLLFTAILACCWFAINAVGSESEAKTSAEKKAPADTEKSSNTAKPSTEKPSIDKSSAAKPGGAKSEIDFVKDIKPIFEKSCYACHGPEDQEAGLRLDIKQKAMAGGDSGPVIVSGKSDKSKLIELVSGLNKEIGRMPPDDEGDALTKEQIELLKKWIDSGANWPDAVAGGSTLEASKYWAYQPINEPKLPAVKNAKWVRNAIDAFILQKLEAENIVPSPEADPVTLLRRVYLDLIGLSPTVEEVESFLADKRPDAYERVVDKLLQSPHYGERWGRHWLDVVRYADSDGYEKDLPRPFAWRYRDWVVNAINDDMPFDIFTVQQLSGDLLKQGDREFTLSARIATGFHRNTLLNKEGGVDPEEDRVKRTIDRTNTLGIAWLGMSVGCANCHTHKYDPITQKEYFELYAFMNTLDEVDLPFNVREAFPERLDTTPKEELPDDRTDDAMGNPTKENSKPAEAKKKVTASVVPPTGGKNPKVDKPAPAKKKSAEEKRLDRIESDKKKAFSFFQAVAEMHSPRKTFVHLRGDFLSPGAEVQPGTLEVLPALAKRGSTADRLDLARWLVSKDHPLTARVTVNRVWLNHFGRGLYATIDDFGKKQDKGPFESPSHPELLDWLASNLRKNNWKMKQLHKLIVTSATYRQSSKARPELIQRDPYNSWLAFQNRLRVEAEVVRDLALASSGLLTRKIGGPSIRPPQPDGISDLTYAGQAEWTVSTGPDRYRRGLYVWFQRTSPYPSLMTFDAPESSLACTRRERSDTPLQSLTLLNDTVFVECAQKLGQQMMKATPVVAGDAKKADIVRRRLEIGFRACVARTPTQSELETVRILYDNMVKMYVADPAAAAKFVGENPKENKPGKSAEKIITKVSNAKSTDSQRLAETAACVAIARVLINLDEFVTRE